MPRLYLIVRFDSTNDCQPSYKTTDISITGMPVSLERDSSRIVETYTVIDEEAHDGPWTYRVAVDIAKMAGKRLHVHYGTSSRDDALERFNRIPDLIEENDKERKHRLENDHTVKASHRWKGQTCVEVKLRKNRFCWYKLVIVNAEDVSKWGGGLEEDDHEGDRWRRRLEVEEAAGGDMDIFEDEEDDMDAT